MLALPPVNVPCLLRRARFPRHKRFADDDYAHPLCEAHARREREDVRERELTRLQPDARGHADADAGPACVIATMPRHRSR